VELVIALVVFLSLLLLGLVIGKVTEMSHFQRLDAEEQMLADIMVSDMKRLPEGYVATEGRLVSGAAVIATDYFKVFAASLRNLFGGEVKSYETLLARARREAMVRMLREARALGANAVWNVRLETSTIQGQQPGKSGGVEALAYGTAMKLQRTR